MAKRKFIPSLEIKYKAPFKTAINPEKGVDHMLNLKAMAIRDIEVRGAGRGLLFDEECEYTDIRVYLQEKPETGVASGV
jgi:hypothetical protein